MGRFLIFSSFSLSLFLLPGVLAGFEPGHNLPSLALAAALCVPGLFVSGVSGYVLPVTPSREEMAWKRDSLLPRAHKHSNKNKDSGAAAAASSNQTVVDAAAACMVAAMEAAVNQTGVANVTEAVATSNTTMADIVKACAGNSTDLVQAVAVAMNETAASANVTSDTAASNVTADTSSTNSTSSSTDTDTGNGNNNDNGNSNSNGSGGGRGKNNDNNNAINVVIDDALQVINNVIGKRGFSDDLVTKTKRDNTKYRESVVRKKWVAGLDERAF
ncbi:uncharacterized protein A1O5_04923 [Cladophialophora psammophila CBS 110553]|uniref:Uncharacterized protein n=1 Tax=Cladophialophora psammophila CBS 110553 TaxID=1182543 RepID=W9XQ19_9EURO|nr:uncharacterized protein A1O5_04923 [Cladophialophora psammophila CBS 110553]EXJ72419.1 hypothetical protein A1O5_04923 [Cladophialophora psammophila CBS 110553]